MACPSSSFSLFFLFPNSPFSSSLILKRSLACLLALIVELYSKGSFMLSLWGRHYCTALHSEATTEDSKLGDNIKKNKFTSFLYNLLLIKWFQIPRFKINNVYQPQFAQRTNINFNTSRVKNMVELWVSDNCHLITIYYQSEWQIETKIFFLN